MAASRLTVIRSACWRSVARAAYFSGMENLQTEPQLAKDAAAVEAFIAKLDAPIDAAVREIRTLIVGADHHVGERIKWNHPAFYFTGGMPQSDPKQFLREIAVFNLFKGRIMLVFTHGAGLNDPEGLLEGAFKDGRRTITFSDLADVRAKAPALQGIIQDWVSRRIHA